MSLSSTQLVLDGVSHALAKGNLVWLATILQTWGSSPRPVGSLMAWSEATGVLGSLSGGCVEDNLIEELAAGQKDSTKPHLQTYGVSQEEAVRLRLPCGGTLRILLEPIQPSDQNREEFQALASALENRQGIARQVNLTDGSWNWQFSSPLKLQLETDSVRQYLGPQQRLLIIGANQVAEYLADFATALDFEVWLCDPRPGALAHWPKPNVTTFSCLPEKLIPEMEADKHFALVTLSHDLRLDDMALLDGVNSSAFYIGAMGSAKTTEARLQRMQALGLSQQQIDKIRAPIGLPIGSKTPAEIAISIAGDLVQHLRQHRQLTQDKESNFLASKKTNNIDEKASV